jgi:hypothetical protein
MRRLPRDDPRCRTAAIGLRADPVEHVHGALIAASGLRSSWPSMARNSSFRRVASCASR